METKDIIVAFIIGLIILILLIAFYTKSFGKVSKVEEGFINGTLKDPYSVTGDAVASEAVVGIDKKEKADKVEAGMREIVAGEINSQEEKVQDENSCEDSGYVFGYSSF